MPKPIEDVTFAILDTETTGLSPAMGAKLCELAILFVRDGKPVGEYQTLINPGVPIDPGAQRIHGISDEMVSDKPKFRQIAQEVRALLSDKVMVCHNLSFDKRFMEAEFKGAGLAMPRIPEVCTLKLARRYFNFSRNGLGHIVDFEIEPSYKEENGLSTTGAHRARNDVLMLSGVFRYLLNKLDAHKKPKTLEDLLALVKS